MILCDHGGQEAKKTSKKAPENGIFSKIQLKQLPITFVRHDPKPFKSYQCAQLLYGNKKEPNNHDSMCSWGSGGAFIPRKSLKSTGFGQLQLNQLAITFFWYDPKAFQSFYYVKLLLGNKKEPNNHDSM